MGEILKAVKLNKSNSKGVLLKNVDFSVEEGEIVLLSGDPNCVRNIMDILGGMSKVSSGKLFLYNEDITQFDDKQLNEYRRRCVGYVSQTLDFVNNLSIKDNIMLVGGNVGISDKILAYMDLSDKANAFPHDLSQIDKITAMLARAMAKSPMLLLFDEPTLTGGDDALFVMNKIRRLNRENGITVILSTQNSVFEADKVIKFKDGGIESISRNMLFGQNYKNVE